jgi:hypothetical protein
LSRKQIVAIFPRLKKSHLALTSPPTPSYNCIAWAAGEQSRKWWPWPTAAAYWPPGVSRNDDLESFLAAFSTLGYVQCEDGSAERAFEKIAFYGRPDGVLHAARQLTNGFWTSKLGDSEDISHSIYGLEAGYYGDVLGYMKRPVSN